MSECELEKMIFESKELLDIRDEYQKTGPMSRFSAS